MLPKHIRILAERNKISIFLVFIFFLIVNLASTGAHIDGTDGVETFLVTEGMVLKNSAKLHPDLPSIEKLDYEDLIDGSIRVQRDQLGIKDYENVTAEGKSTVVPVPLAPIYLKRSVLLSAIAVPFYYVATIFQISPVTIVYGSVNSLIISLIATVVFCFSVEIYKSRKTAFLSSLIFAVCSFIWPYNTTLLPQPLQALCLIASVYFIYLSSRINNSRKAASVAGLGALFLGLTTLAHPSSVIFFIGVMAYAIVLLRHNWKKLIPFLIVLGITILLVGFLNHLRFGSYTEFGYGNEGTLATHNGWKGLLGLLVSPGAGILFFFPTFILLPIAMKYLYGENKGLVLLTLYITLVSWLYFGTINLGLLGGNMETSGWQGAAYGPRYFIPALPFIVIVIGVLVRPMKGNLILKISVTTLCIAGFSINLLGTLIWYPYGYYYSFTREGLNYFQQIYDQTKVSSLGATMWLPEYSQTILNIKVLTSGYLSNMSPEEKINLGATWPHSFGLAPCSYNLYLFCKFGITPIIVMITVIVILGLFIFTGMSFRSFAHLHIGEYFTRAKVNRSQ